MTDTARDEHSPKNGALGNGGNHRGIPPSGVTTHGHVTGISSIGIASGSSIANSPIANSSIANSPIANSPIANSPIPSSPIPINPIMSSPVVGNPIMSSPFGSTDLRAPSELESGVHPTASAAPLRAPGDAVSSLDLVLLSVTETQVAPGWAAAEEELSHYELTVIVRGMQSTLRDDGEASSGPVEALLLKPGMRRQERNKGEVDLHRLRIGFTWRTAPSELPETVQDTCGRLHEIASWLVAERDAQFPNVSDYRQGLLRALVGEYLRLSVVAASRIEEKTRTYMLRHLGEPITLEDLATNIGMSRYYFCRVYKEVAGHTPMEHLRALRLERAKDLIRSTALPLKAIAPEVGFGSAQHLCRLLHDRFGVGVRELRGAGTLESRGVMTDRGRDPDEAS
jgi:AraC-like DNA-binding protein